MLYPLSYGDYTRMIPYSSMYLKPKKSLRPVQCITHDWPERAEMELPRVLIVTLHEPILFSEDVSLLAQGALIHALRQELHSILCAVAILVLYLA